MSDTNFRSGDSTITAGDFYENIKDKEKFIVLDIRSEEISDEWSLEFEGVETINYPYFDLIDDIPDNLDNQLSKTSDIVVICSKGISSQTVTNNLRELGYNARTLKDGTNGWSKIYERRQIPTSVDELVAYQYIRPASGCLGYMVISDNEAVVIDPLKQYTERYIEDAREKDCSIEYVIDTHIHADHISGFKNLLESSDATGVMCKNSKSRGVEYSFRTVEDGDNIYFGSESLEVMNTPGHTTDMTSYRLADLLFTGDSLFLDSIARPDLEDSDEAENMASVLYTTIQEMFELSSDTVIAPGHKSGIHATDSVGNTFSEYLGTVREELDISEYDKDEFVHHIMKDMPPRPANYESIININKGQEETSDDEEYRLELGPNNCSAG